MGKARRHFSSLGNGDLGCLIDIKINESSLRKCPEMVLQNNFLFSVTRPDTFSGLCFY